MKRTSKWPATQGIVYSELPPSDNTVVVELDLNISDAEPDDGFADTTGYDTREEIPALFDHREGWALKGLLALH